MNFGLGGKYRIGFATDAGKKYRDENQDSIGIYRPGLFGPRQPMCVVADGMGGYLGGSTASKTVVSEFMTFYRQNHRNMDAANILKEAASRTHQILKRKSKANEQLSAMGSTVVAGIFEVERLVLLNVGDSRAYHFQASRMCQISKDQSKVAEMVAGGLLTQDEARSYPQRNVLTMSFSVRRNHLEPYEVVCPVESGDRFLFCSDGLWSMVPEEEIQQFVENMPVQKAAENLILQANYYGGADNISAIVVEVR